MNSVRQGCVVSWSVDFHKLCPEVNSNDAKGHMKNPDVPCQGCFHLTGQSQVDIFISLFFPLMGADIRDYINERDNAEWQKPVTHRADSHVACL